MAQRAVLIGLCAAAAVAGGAWLLADGWREGGAAEPVVIAGGPHSPVRASDGELVLASDQRTHDQPSEAEVIGAPSASEREVVEAAPRARVMLRGQLSGARGLGSEIQLSVAPDFGQLEGSNAREILIAEPGSLHHEYAAPPSPFPSNPSALSSRSELSASGQLLLASPDSLALETRDDGFEFRQRLVGVMIRGAVLEFDRALLAGRIAAAQRHVGELAERSRRHVLKRARAQDRAFERQLRREPGTHLLFGRRRSGLVIENRVAAVRQ